MAPVSSSARAVSQRAGVIGVDVFRARKGSAEPFPIRVGDRLWSHYEQFRLACAFRAVMSPQSSRALDQEVNRSEVGDESIEIKIQ